MSSALSTALIGEDPGNLDDLLKFHVREALRSKLQAGSCDRRSLPYNSLVNQIRIVKEQALKDGNDDRVEQLISILDALTACVSNLHERNHEALIHEVLSIPIWKTGQDVRTPLLRLLIHMVVANSALVPVCLRVLVLAMQPPPAPPKPEEEGTVPRDAWQPASGVVEIQSEVIAALNKVLTLVPTAPSRMVAAVAGAIPYKLRDRDAQCAYLRAALQLAQAAAAAPVREGILAAAVTHLLGLDVEIRWQDIAAAEAEAEEEEGESEKEEEEDIFALEGETEHLHLSTPGQPQELPNQERIQGRGGWEGAARGSDAAEASTSGQPATAEIADKLDALMGLVFEHLEHRCEQGQLPAAWTTLLHTFERSILDTHRSKFTQYLLWYLCKQGPQQCSASFLELLLQRLANPNVAPITRSAAAAYLASFLARANFIPEPLLLNSLQSLAEWCLSYCRDQDSRAAAAPETAITTASTSTRLDLDTGPAKGIQHQVFYAACQALLYILCYRLEQLWKEAEPAHSLESTSPTGVLESGTREQVTRLFSDIMPQVLNHRLAPLSVCLPTVVNEFSQLTDRLRLMDCKGLLPQRAQAMRAQRPLEMFFPFDPYLLRRSAQYLDLSKTYVHWRQGQPQAAAVEGAHDDASDLSDEEDVDVGLDSENGEEVAASDEEENDDTASSFGDDSESADSEDEGNQRMDMADRRQRMRRKSSAPWPHAPLSGMRPVSALESASRKRAASCTPGSEQGFLHGASVDTNSFGGGSLHGASPGASPSVIPMSWMPAAETKMVLPVDAQ